VSKSRYAITPKLVSLLLSRGANPNHHAEDNITATHTAASVGNTEVMEILHKSGARLDVRDTQLRTPMIVAAMQHQQKAMEHLIAWGLGVNDYDREGNTPLIYAYQNGDRISANLLLSNGANIYHRNRQNNNAASIAWNRQDKDMIDMLYVYSSGNASSR
jgi:ankyrin repeat protein